MKDFNPDEVWQAVYERLALSPDDLQKIKSERGLSESTIISLGFKSSGPHNRQLLRSLDHDFPPDKLVAMGIFTKRAGEYSVNGQLCGFGMSSERDEKGDRVWREGVNPIIIPYLDAGAHATYLRPHKGGLRRPDYVDDLDQSYSGQHVYTAHLLRTIATTPHYEDLKGFLVLTEGEWKAAALFECGIPALAMPGIQAMRNKAFKDALIDMLHEFNIEEVIVCFDNELKDDPSLPGYKVDPYDRYDSIVYARYTKSALKQEGIKARVVYLPDDWRIHGKADWDSALVKFITESRTHNEGVKKARREFLKVLKNSDADTDQIKLIRGEKENIVESKLSRIYHTRQCQIGDDKIAKLAQRLRPKNALLAAAFQKCIGKYFVRKPPKDKDEIQRLRNMRNAAFEAKNWLEFTEAKELLEGMPEPISNFTMRCHFKLISAMGTTEYLVSVRNIHKEATDGHIRISADALSKLSEFRKFCLSRANSTFQGGERDLQDLTSDMQADSAFRDIHELNTYGFCESQKFWKFGNKAFTDDGRVILPDANNVFWHDGLGYQTDFGREVGSGFDQGAPLFGDYNQQDAVDSFLLLSKHLFNAIGDYDGWMAIGAILAYAAHPEILQTYQGAPGLWFTGRKGGGKSTIAQWLMRIWGFPGKKVVLTAETTNNYVARELSKYGCLPCALDEFREDRTRVEVKDILKNAFNRSAGGKATFDASNRTRSVRPQTTPMVLGESSCGDAATRSRYTNITILDERAREDAAQRLAIMTNGEKKFSALGQFLMLHRKDFATRTMQELDFWVGSNKTASKIPKVRERFISGTPWASFLSISNLLYEKAEDKDKPALNDIVCATMGSMMNFALDHGSESQKETIDTSFASEFWLECITLLQMGEMPKKYFHLRYAKWDSEKKIVDLQDNNTFDPELKPVLLVAYREAYHMYQVEIRKAGKFPKLSIQDLQREFKNERYWVKPKPQSSHRVQHQDNRFTCWCFDVEGHPFGNDFRDILQEKTPA